MRLRRHASLLLTAFAIAALAPAGRAGKPETPGKPGFYGVARQEGVWWFVTPEGKREVSIGINHVDPLFLLSEGDLQRSLQTYGADLVDARGRPNLQGEGVAKFMDRAITEVQGWGFNALGMHTPPVGQRRLPYVKTLRPAKVDGFIHDHPDYPDPFDPATEAAVDAVAKAKLAPTAEDPLVLGIAFSDMTIWRQRPAEIHAWVRALRELGPSAPGKKAWVELLRSRHGDPRKAARVHGVEAETWEAIAERRTWPASRSKEARADAAAMLAQIADAWYGLVVRVARRHDPNHLILGDKLIPPFDVPDWLLPILGKHVDVVYLQWYATAEEQIPLLREIHQKTGRPILMGDSSFSTPSRRVPEPKGVRLGSQEAVGEAYAGYLERILAEPYVVGWHYCGYMEGAPDLARFHKFNAMQNGFVLPDGTVHEAAVSRVKAANARAAEWHEAAARTPAAPEGPAARGDAARRAPQEARRKGSGGKVPVEVLHKGRDYTLRRIDGNVYELRSSVPGSRVPQKPVSWIVTGDGVVVYDTGSEASGKLARRLIREVTSEPIRYIVYSHHHGTQLGGAASLKEEGTTVIAHEDFVTELEDMLRLDDFSRRLNSLQFNLRTPPGAFRLEPWKPLDAPPAAWSGAPAAVDRAASRFVFPDEVYDGDRTIELGSVEMVLHHASGDADDYTILWLPEQRIAFVADMLGAFPMVASPMKKVRDEVAWRRSLEWVRDREPRAVLFTGAAHVDPGTIRGHLDTHIALLGFLHDAIVHELNAGARVDEAVERIRLPEEIAASRWSKDQYGTLGYSIRGLYQRYSGWFDQNATHLDPVPEPERARSFVATMGGAARVLAEAERIRAGGNPRLALEYLDLLIVEGPHPEAHDAKAAILLALARATGHGISRSIYEKSAQIEKARAEAARGNPAGEESEPGAQETEATSPEDEPLPD